MHFSEPTAKIWMKIDPNYRQQNHSTFWKNKVYADIRRGSLGRWRQMTLGLSTPAIFSAFGGSIFGNFSDKACIIIIAIRSLSSVFYWSRNAWPWMILNGYFRLNSVFASEAATFEKNAWKLIKTDQFSQQQYCSAESLVSVNIRSLRIFARVSWRGASNENLVFQMGLFSTSVWLSSVPLPTPYAFPFPNWVAKTCIADALFLSGSWASC